MLKANAGDQVSQLQDQIQKMRLEHQRAIATLEDSFAAEKAKMIDETK